MSQFITFEQPLNERIRNLLRLEFLFKQSQHFLTGTSTWDSRLVMATIQDILTLVGRGDIKAELLREVERHIACLTSQGGQSPVAQQQRAEVLDELEQLRVTFHAMSGPFGQELRDNELLNAVRQRNSFSSGPCDFDLPLYHHWLHCAVGERQRNLQQWLDSLDLLRRGVVLLLRLVRGSAQPTEETAEKGFFHRNLEPALPYQLLRITLAEGTPYFVEISGGKHRFTVRFLEPSPTKRPQQTSANVDFQLNCCSL